MFALISERPSRQDSIAGTSSVGRANSRLISTTLQQHYAETATIFPTLYLNTECVHSFLAHGSSVTTVKFNSSGNLLVSGGFDRLVKIWNFQGNCLKTLGDHTRYVNAVAINVSSSLFIINSTTLCSYLIAWFNDYCIRFQRQIDSRLGLDRLLHSRFTYRQRTEIFAVLVDQKWASSSRRLHLSHHLWDHDRSGDVRRWIQLREISDRRMVLERQEHKSDDQFCADFNSSLRERQVKARNWQLLEETGLWSVWVTLSNCHAKQLTID